jgi:TonB family protein
MSCAPALVACALLLSGVPDLGAQGQPTYVVIVNPSTPPDVLGGSFISDAFLKRQTRWPGGDTIEPVDLSGEPEIRETFSREVHGKSTSNVRAFWNQEVFSGRSTPPLELATSHDVVEFVKSHTAAIGYVSAQTPLEGVKKVDVVIPPRVVRRVEPRYPPSARSARISGDVVLSVEISKTGSISKISVLRELGFGCTAEALNAVKGWQFEPGRRSGMPLAQELTVTISFSPPS